MGMYLTTKIWVFEGGGRDQGDPNLFDTSSIHCRLSLRNMPKLGVGGVQLECFTCNISNLFSRNKKTYPFPHSKLFSCCFALFFFLAEAHNMLAKCMKCNMKSAIFQLIFQSPFTLLNKNLQHLIFKVFNSEANLPLSPQQNFSFTEYTSNSGLHPHSSVLQ